MLRAIKTLAIVILLLLIAGVIWFGWELVRPAASPARDIGFTVESGQGVNLISANLRRAGLIHSSFVFETYIWAIKSENKVIAGRYKLSSGMNIPQVTAALIRGTVAQNDKVTFIEGWNRNDNTDYLQRQGFNGQEYLQLTASSVTWRDDYPLTQAIPDNGSLEGFLFPDTYAVTQDTKVISIIDKQLQNFESKLTPTMIEDIRHSGHTLFQIVTMASILEKEVPQHADKKMIADIFWKRIKANIGLQSDATINFVTGKGTTRPSLDDLKIDSPYNTYKYKGLTPGPISNPGLESIQAALYPTPNPYYYFLTDKDGGVHYAKDLEGHKQNRVKYLE